MRGRLDTMREGAIRAIEALGDQVQDETHDLIYFPFMRASVTGVIVSGQEDQYLVLCGPEGRPFAVIRHDGKIMPWPAPDLDPMTCTGEIQPWAGFFQGYPVIQVLDHDRGQRGLSAITAYRVAVPIPGSDRFMVYCRDRGRTCGCCRGDLGNRLETDLLSAALGLQEIGNLIGGGVWGNKV